MARLNESQRAERSAYLAANRRRARAFRDLRTLAEGDGLTELLGVLDAAYAKTGE